MTNFTYSPEGMMTAQSATWTTSREMLEKAMEKNLILEAIAISCDCEHNLIVDLGVMKGIIPREEVVLPLNGEPVKEVAILSRVGKEVCFKIIGFDQDEQGNDCAILSRREAQSDCWHEYLMERTIGDVISARVTHMSDFGAFVDVGCGISSMIPLASISVSRISHPQDRFEVGMNIKAVVTGVDYYAHRIYLSHKELLGTWEENAERFSAGQTVVGTIRSVEPYGAFVELAPNLAGLAELKGNYRPGQNVSVFIKSILPERMKIKLAIIADCSHSGLAKQRVTDYYADPTVEHIDHWSYSPTECAKVIRSDFGSARSAFVA
jgi:small subunit ribosomal protein S1